MGHIQSYNSKLWRDRNFILCGRCLSVAGDFTSGNKINSVRPKLNSYGKK